MRAKAVSAVVPLAIVNIGTSVVKSALNVTSIEKSLLNPSVSLQRDYDMLLVALLTNQVEIQLICILASRTYDLNGNSCNNNTIFIWEINKNKI